MSTTPRRLASAAPGTAMPRRRPGTRLMLARAALGLVAAFAGGCGGGGSGAPDTPPGGATTVAPAVTAQPVATSADVGSTANFSASASGTPAPTAQWQQSTDGGTTWADIAGATATTLTTAAVTAGDDGTDYRAVFSNSAGSATSGTATLHVLATGVVTVGLKTPLGLALDTAGNLYIADTFNYVIRKITPAGVATVLAGQVGTRGVADGVGSAARFGVPHAIAVDAAGTIYVGDEDACAIRKIAPDGTVSTLAGHSVPSCITGLDGTGAAASFLFPTGVALDPEGNVFVSENDAHDLRMIRPTGETSTIAGSVSHQGNADGLGANASFVLPSGVAFGDANNIYVLDETEVRLVTQTGSVTHLVGADGQIGSADGPADAARFHEPQGIAVDPGGNLAIADTENFTIRRVTNRALVTTIAGQVNTLGSTDGDCAVALFNRPHAVAFDSAGVLYVADTDNNSIRKIVLGPPCKVTTIVK